MHVHFGLSSLPGAAGITGSLEGYINAFLLGSSGMALNKKKKKKTAREI